MSSIPVQIKIIDKRQELPKYAKRGDAAFDLRAAIDKPMRILSAVSSVLVPTGIAIYISDPRYAAMILPRSGSGHKLGLITGNNVGLIDSLFQGELMVSLCIRPGHDDYEIQPLERIAQLVIVPVMQADFRVVTEFSEATDRGDGGFGSSGKH